MTYKPIIMAYLDNNDLSLVTPANECMTLDNVH